MGRGTERSRGGLAALLQRRKIVLEAKISLLFCFNFVSSMGVLLLPAYNKKQTLTFRLHNNARDAVAESLSQFFQFLKICWTEIATGASPEVPQTSAPKALVADDNTYR